MKLSSAGTISAWLALTTIVEAVTIEMYGWQGCTGRSLSCPNIAADQCCNRRPNPEGIGSPAASSKFIGLPPTAAGLTFQNGAGCRGDPANVGFGVTFCVNSVPSVYESVWIFLISGAKWQVASKKCETSSVCDGWDLERGLWNGVDMGEPGRVGTIPINLFSRNSHDRADEDKKECLTAEQMTFANGHRFNIREDVMPDVDYALLHKHFEADSNMEDIPEHLHRYEVDHEGALARRELNGRGMKDSAERLADHYAEHT